MACTFGKWIRKLIDRSPAVRFVIIGAIATIIHYLVYYLLISSGLYYIGAYILGYLISLIFNFFATGRFTFRTTLSASKGVMFFVSHAINFVLHIGLLELFVRVIGISNKIAPIFVLCIAVPVNYFLVRFAMRGKASK